MAMWKYSWDPDGHEESITAFKKMLGDNAFCCQTGLQADVHKDVSQAMTNRHVADYSPYDRQRSNKQGSGFESISEGDWRLAVLFNEKCATKILNAAYRFIMDIQEGSNVS
jgi:hypothetical protein